MNSGTTERDFRVDPDVAGWEIPDLVEKKPYPRVKNQYCFIDGHYCEQPSCENCNYEKLGE